MALDPKDMNDKTACKASGCRYVQAGRYIEALLEFDKALKLSQGEKEFESCVRTEKANAYMRLSRYGLAMKHLKKALILDQNNQSAYKLSGNIYSRYRRYEEALGQFDKGLKLLKGDKESESDFYHEKANAYLGLKEFGLAMEQAKKAIRLNPDNKYGHKLSGCISLHQRQYEEAVCEFEKALELSVGDKDFELGIYNELGRIYFERGQYGQVISRLNKAVELDPENGMTRWLLAIAYKYHGSYEEALSEFVKVMNLRQNDKKAAERVQFEIIKLVEYANVNGDDKVQELIKKALNVKFSSMTMIENSLNNELEIVKRAVRLKTRARKLIVNLTNQCNLDCKMCLNKKFPKQEISDKMKTEIINSLPYLESINWVGGEAFLYPGFEELIDEAIKYPVIQEITTNALLIDKKTAVKLVQNNVKLTISIDGVTKEVYEDIRKGAKYGSLIEKLKMLDEVIKRTNPENKLTLNVVVLKSNYSQIEAFTEFAKEYNFGAINFMIVTENRNNENIFNFDRDKEVLSFVSKALDNAKQACEKHGIIFNTNITKNLLEDCPVKDQVNTSISVPLKQESGKSGVLRPESNVLANVKMCQAPWKTLNINMDGETSPNASCFCRNVVGNLNKQSMEEIWNGEVMVNYRKQIAEGNIEKVCTLKQIYNEIPFELLR